ncbi:hypothetical protein BDV98DRAFT_620396 [Pterulicium gracile]|uniref:Tf2-1-like SH3-like domain-containing protein n=1 Tax=Pterulicium gracile TaxID=1884261 RepID=A0A5C3Q4H9_9AGAR|nr:hypothetical protein BDV98DRAFT_620396 [Pterula gracilis]
MPNRLGLFEVLEVTGKNTYKLDLDPKMKIHNVINVDCLFVVPEPPAVLRVNGQEKYKVEAILDSHIFRRKLEYFIK